MKTDDGETITYREWLIDRNERLTRADKKEAARAYMVKEKAILAKRATTERDA